jgi:hypothetical protein
VIPEENGISCVGILDFMGFSTSQHYKSSISVRVGAHISLNAIDGSN